MKSNLSFLLICIFFMGYSQSRKIENTDQKYLSLLEQTYTNNINSETVELVKKETHNYEKFVGENPTKKQKINLSAGKMFLKLYIDDYDDPLGLLKLCRQVITDIGESKDYPRLLSIAYRELALSISRLNASHETVDMYYKKAIKIAEEAGLYHELGEAYDHLSRLSVRLHDYEKGLEYNQKAEFYMSKDIKERQYIDGFKLNKIMILLKLYRQNHQNKTLDSADSSIHSLLKKRNVLNSVYGLKAYSDFLKQDYKTALVSLDSSSFYSKSNRGYVDNNEYRDGLRALIYYRIDEPVKGQSHIKKINIKDLDPNHLLYEVLYQELYIQSKKQGNYKEALEFYEKQDEIKKNNYFLNYQLQVRKFNEKLKVAEKDVQLAQLQTNKKSLTIGVIIIANLLLIGTVLSIIYFRRRGKQLKKVENDIKTFTENEIHKINYAKDEAVSGLRKQFSTQLHNDVGSILVATSSFLKSKKKLENNDEDKELWDDISEELQKVYNIVRNESHQIYDSSFDNAKFLTDLEKNIRLIFSGQSIDLHTNINIEKEKSLTPEIKLCILSTVREACTNILKYGKAKNVSIDLTNDNGNIYLEISNDSKKRSLKSKQVSLGIGLINLNEQIKKLNGNFSANHTEDGFVISAEIPFK